MVLALVLMVPLIFPAKLVGAIGTTIGIGMTAAAAVLFFLSVHLLFRCKKDVPEQPYTSPGRGTITHMEGGIF
ncbi:MAG: hypothetical protein JXA45_04755 [Methanomassiliicoccales archaeon]|nr:hypothetical protein [Methanomassiliicoccales archaeon]